MDAQAIAAAVHDLTAGKGYVMLEGFHGPDQVAEARELIYRLAEEEPERTSHFHGNERVRTQKRVWNLPDKGRVFRDICGDERLLAMLEPVLGDVRLASFAANVLYPGAPAQEAHVDYPYWDLHKPERFPMGLNPSFMLEVETLVMLDDFTLDNGATALVPASQRDCVWPDQDSFARRHIRATGPAGTLLLFPALTWHAGQANTSRGNRAALLGCYTAKFVKPLEDWKLGLSEATRADLSPRMVRLLGLDETYPAVMDGLPGRSSEGTRAREGVYAEKAA
ncbi:MAG: phytanoyl-CoA dioxygenase family protein [Geminicoccaceae bacterium]